MRTLLAGILLFMLSHFCEAESSTSFHIIVNANNSVTTLDRKSLSEIFLKKVTRWPDGELTQPADLSQDSNVRSRFSDEIMGRPIAGVKNYWQQRIFSGRDVPPPELISDEDVIKYVMRHPGGIGYVSNAADLRNVKVLNVR
jgi:ABC-type phosphate transport system substrate-binding protein